jgi:hypothetical protein
VVEHEFNEVSEKTDLSRYAPRDVLFRDIEVDQVRIQPDLSRDRSTDLGGWPAAKGGGSIGGISGAILVPSGLEQAAASAYTAFPEKVPSHSPALSLPLPVACTPH